MTTEEMWDTLMNDYGVSEDTLRVVTDVVGYSTSTLEAVLYSVAGLNDFDQEG